MKALLVLAPLLGPSAQEEPPLELRVNRAIARAVAYLKGQQLPDGGFPGHEDQHPGGTTALVALAFAKSGVRRNDEALLRALKSLEGRAMQSTYSAAVHLMMCQAVGDEPRRRDASTSLAFLVEHQQPDGLWAYPWEHECCSNTQYALLGIRAAHSLGLAVPEKTLVAAAEGVWHFQDGEGAFHYDLEKPAYDGIHVAALSGLAILDELGAGVPAVESALRKHEKDRRRAEAWFEAHFEVERNHYASGAWTPYWHYGYLWAIERWCGLTQRKLVAGQDWYTRGADWLVSTQGPDGSWTSDDKPLENTCMALFFLRRATLTGESELAEIYARIDSEAVRREVFDRRPPKTATRLTDWLLAGPWQGKPDQRALVELPFDPARVKAKEGTKLAKREWCSVKLSAERWTDLDVLTANDGDHRLWALAGTLAWTGSSPAEVELWLELEDGWDVYLDGARVSFERRVSSAIDGDVCIPLALAPGEHELLILISDDGGAAAFGARLSSADGSAPPPGLAFRSGGETRGRR